MSSVPFHPVIVHIPLVLALVVPAVTAYLVWRSWRGAASRRAWAVALGLQAVVLGGAVVALRTGGAEEERVEERVPEAAIEAHEERAELFTAAAALTCLLIAGATALRGRGAAAVGGAATAAGLLVIGLGVETGKAGGELVYQHGAAAAYASAAAGAGEGAGEAGEGAGEAGEAGEGARGATGAATATPTAAATPSTAAAATPPAAAGAPPTAAATPAAPAGRGGDRDADD